jgi:hypothetical protein
MIACPTVLSGSESDGDASRVWKEIKLPGSTTSTLGAWQWASSTKKS